jgi:prepilin-type N-terminal cleavage/methylation domain-containing protein
MYIDRNKRAFTLLEVIMAVAILAMVGLSVYRFLEVNVRAVTYAASTLKEERQFEGLVAMLDSQIKALPVNARGVIMGEAYKFQGAAADELRWKTTAGNGLFTVHAAAEYDVTLALAPVQGKKTFQLGIRRELSDGSSDEVNWLPLISNVSALEVHYFDSRLNDWLDRWSEVAARPSLIRVRILRPGEEMPYEAIIRIPTAQFVNPTTQ